MIHHHFKSRRGCHLASRDAVREELVATIAGAAYGPRTVSPLLRLALVGRLAAVEGVAPEWIGALGVEGRRGRAEVAAPLVRQPRANLTVIEEFAPDHPAPPAHEVPENLDDHAPVTGSP